MTHSAPPHAEGMKAASKPGENLLPEATLYDLLWQVGAQAVLLCEEEFADSPLTPASANVLTTIAAEPGISVAEISRRIPKTPQTISQVIARLQKLELVERRVREGRGIALHVTPEGAKLAKDAAARIKRVDTQLRETLGSHSAQTLQTLLSEGRERLRDAPL